MKKSKQNKTQKNNNNVDSNEIARQIAIETIKDTEKFFQRIANFFKGIWKFLTTPGMILGIFKFQKNGKFIFLKILRELLSNSCSVFPRKTGLGAFSNQNVRNFDVINQHGWTKTR